MDGINDEDVNSAIAQFGGKSIGIAQPFFFVFATKYLNGTSMVPMLKNGVLSYFHRNHEKLHDALLEDNLTCANFGERRTKKFSLKN